MAEIERITGHTHLVGLIANPIRHSQSPAMHNASFAQQGVDAHAGAHAHGDHHVLQ